VEEDLIGIVEETSSLGMVLGDFNSTFTTLIPKNDKLETFD